MLKITSLQHTITWHTKKHTHKNEVTPKYHTDKLSNKDFKMSNKMLKQIIVNILF